MPVSIKPKAASATPTQPTTSNKPTPSFIKTGDAAKKALAEQEAAAELAREASNKPRRFYITDKNLGKDFDLTFLDGDLDGSGEIQMNTWSEHFRKIAGKWTNMVCLAPDYCPNCIADDRSTIVAAFTVVDHTPYEIQSGQRKGEVIPWQRKLYIVKQGTLAQLNKFAGMRGGLRGVRFCVTRTTAKSPQVGDMLVPYDGKYDDAELKTEFPADKDGNRQDVPFDYATAAPYFTAEELKGLGVGSATTVIGKEVGADLSSQL